MDRFPRFGTVPAPILACSAVCGVGLMVLVMPARVLCHQTFTASASTVALYVTVVDRSGRLVTGLKASDFEISDDGKPQRVTQFEATSVPLTVVLMLDDSPSLHASQPSTRSAAAVFFRRLRPGDRATFGTFSRTVRMDGNLTSDREELLARLQTPTQPMAGTALWDALNAGMSVMDDEPGRRVVLLLTDGEDNSSDTEPAVTVARATRDAVMLYAIGIRGRDGRLSKRVGDLALETGGWFFELKERADLEATLQRVADELHSQYLLGFAISSLDGKPHKLEVKLRRSGLRARARQSYVAPSGKLESDVARGRSAER